MTSFLIDSKRGLVIGSFSRRGTGWSFMPHTTARQASRKAHPTKAVASRRFRTETTRIIEAKDVVAAVEIAQGEKELYSLVDVLSRNL